MKGDGEVTEGAFIQRYRDVTGETDIDRVTHANPGTPWIVAGGAAIAVGTIGSLALFVASETETTCSETPAVQMCFTQDSSSAKTAAEAGSLGLAVLGIVGAAVLVSGLHANRMGHELSRDEAERFVHRYNRALLDHALRSAKPWEPPQGDAGGEAK